MVTDDRLAHGDHHALDLEQGALLLRAALRDALQDGPASRSANSALSSICSTFTQPDWLGSWP